MEKAIKRRCWAALIGLVGLYELGFVFYIRSGLWWDTGTRPFNWIYAPRMAVKLYPIKYSHHQRDGGFHEIAYWIGGGDIRVDSFWPDGKFLSRVRENFDGRIIS